MVLGKIQSVVFASIMLVPSFSAVATVSLPVFAAEDNMAEAVAELSDAQIAGAANVANEQIVKAAKTAQKSAANQKLIDYANSMIREHERFSSEFKAVLNKVSVSPSESVTSVELRTDALRDAATLVMLKGADFDKKYLHQHLGFQQRFIDLLDSTLIPGAKNPEIKSYLQAMRADLVKCVDAGKALQTEIGT